MARPTSQMNQWARAGAQARLNELRAEIAAIARAFPGLDRASTGGATRAPIRRGRRGRKGGRRRGGISAEGRRRISEAQKARWAAQRADAGVGAAKRGARKGGGRKRRGMSAAARKAVSERMRRYWAARRAAKKR